MELEKELNSDIGAISVETDLGKLSLDKYFVHLKSYAQGFIVIHKSKIVYEEYPGMQDLISERQMQKLSVH